jgi:DNA-directed RNA polymerase specialized sigma24 family protein
MGRSDVPDRDQEAQDRAAAAARDVAPSLRQHLRSRFRLLAHEEDDLVQQTLVDLHVFLAKQDTSALTDSDLRALAFTIFNRRIADRIRADARDRAFASLQLLDEPAAPSSERVVRYRRLLVAVLRHVASLSPDDQLLLLEDVLPQAKEAAHSGSDRKRRTRLRQMLSVAIEREFGAQPKDYMGETDG